MTASIEEYRRRGGRASRRGTLLLAAGLLGCLLGCGPRRVLDAPGNWPEEWQGLKLYNTPQAFIYARNQAVAGEGDRLLRKVAREFGHLGKHRAEPGKGLLLVSDRVEDLPVKDPKEHYLLTLRSSLEPEAAQQAEQTIDERWDSIEASLAEQGIDPAAELPLRSLALDQQAVGDILALDNTSLAEIRWAVEWPTRALIERAGRKVINDKIAHRGGGPLEVVVTAPLLVVEESRMVNNAAVNRDVTLFTQWVRQAGWDSETSQELVQRYTQRKVDEAMLTVLVAVRDTIVEVTEPVVQPFVPKASDGDGGAGEPPPPATDAPQTGSQ